MDYSAFIRPAIVPVAALLFSILPVRVSKQQLLSLAFSLWMVGGIGLSFAGAQRLSQVYAETDLTLLLVALVITVVVGIAKGKFVLGKTSQRNIERIQHLDGPQKLVQIYSTRSWIIIGIMLLLSASLTIFSAPIFWRGIVNLGVGLALIMSSLNYLNTASTATSSN